jgi:ATP-dependent exoDNAse (exonuclease V) alpha subunit
MTKPTYLKDNNIEYVFIDEISMVHEILYKFFILMKKLKQNLKFIISGDFNQLKPVNDRYMGTYKNSHALYELCDGQRIELSTCRRADDKLYNLCLDTSLVGDNTFTKNNNKINLCYTNKKRMEINRYYMNKMIAKNKSKGLYLPKLRYVENSQDVNLFEGMPIIAYKNSAKYNIINNESFKITDIDDDCIEFGNKREKCLSIPIDEFQKYFFVSYAITIHKSQGDTIKKSFTIHECDRLDKRLKYVALSRATTCDHINII